MKRSNKNNKNLKLKKKKPSKKKQSGFGVYDNAFLNLIIGDESPVYIEDASCKTEDCCYRKDPYIDIDQAYKGNFENMQLKKNYKILEKKYKYADDNSYYCFLKSNLRQDYNDDIMKKEFDFLNPLPPK